MKHESFVMEFIPIETLHDFEEHLAQGHALYFRDKHNNIQKYGGNFNTATIKDARDKIAKGIYYAVPKPKKRAIDYFYDCGIAKQALGPHPGGLR